MKRNTKNGPAALQLYEPTGEIGYSIETVVSLTQTPRHQIAVYCRHGLIAPVNEPEREGWRFDHETIRVLRRIGTLRTNYALNLDGLCAVAELLKELEALRAEVRFLRRF